MLDHLVLATPDLAATVADVARRTGVEAAPGGQHRGWGTANQLIALGDGAYLEIVGPDPASPEPGQARPFRIDELTGPRIVTWAVRTTRLDAAIARAREHGYDPGPGTAMSRTTPDGQRLAWRLTPALVDGFGVVPFLIDWQDSPHPTSRDLPMLRLARLELRHPDDRTAAARLAALGSDQTVRHGTQQRIELTVDGPRGRVVLT